MLLAQLRVMKLKDKAWRISRSHEAVFYVPKVAANWQKGKSEQARPKFAITGKYKIFTLLIFYHVITINFLVEVLPPTDLTTSVTFNRSQVLPPSDH